MEKRLLIAIVLSFLVLFLYQAFFVKKPPLQEEYPAAAIEMEQSPVQKPRPEISQKEPTESERVISDLQEEKSFEAVSEEAEREIIVDTPLYHAVWSNKGGVLKSWRLKEHKNESKEDLELISSRSAETKKYPFFLSTENPEFDLRINTALYKASSFQLELAEGQTGMISFEYADENGNRVEKSFSFTGGKYFFDVDIQVWKDNIPVEPRLHWGPSFGTLAPATRGRAFGASKGIAVYESQKVRRHDEKKYKPEESIYNFVPWAAYEDQYFTALFLTSPQKTSAMFLQEENEQVFDYYLTLNHPQKAYIGPKDIDALTEMGFETKKLIRLGIFGFIAEILLKAIKSIHSVFPNWGFSIIILTLIVKIIFFPLTYSSTKSMSKMQELQPKIKALRARYKKAKQDIGQRRKMNEEIMKLYKEHGVNPAGGCLPILIQLPIFWGFFTLLRVSLEFRHSPFILWIQDLSVKDPLFITPILMGITQFISQKMTPTSADPAQQRMMLIMPVVMTIFFMNFQSGLVLYWLTNNVLQIGQQYIMNRFIKKKKRESHGKRRKK
jgi:YidC/Oxa1 family membrane protein insertase